MKKFYLLPLFAIAFLISSCTEFPDIAPSANIVGTDDTEIEAYFLDIDDMIEVILSENTIASNGVDVLLDDPRMVNANIYLETPETSTPAIVIVDFGDGTADAKGNIRKGRLHLEVSTLEEYSNNTGRLTIENYSINGIRIEGNLLAEHEVDVEAKTLFSYVEYSGRVTWPDGTFATRNSQAIKDLSWAPENPVTWIQNGNANGVGRSGVGYYTVITEGLLFERECLQAGNYTPTSGKKRTIGRHLEANIDYGNGTCDNEVMITIEEDRTYAHTFTFEGLR
ncbi:hypothetical protein KIH41_09975 [Litoribacter ruber]|uniref:hypothetical protein n=1 Tax=Litoribacter ruber TaxID=702568 RepID=UPI001BDA89C3|nr:hypothetical protein [Litoribacter ruber]MBT0811604.1 hypothetical protein [Litoribacter ruber]